MPSHLPHPSYRPDIDGLRAVAVSSVVIFHIWPAYMPGGFSGVDVFFVISGFLISTILLVAFSNGTFSLAEFYGRRIRRIFPALTAVLVASLLVGWLILSDREFKALGKHVLGGVFFVSNFILRYEAGYFDTAAELKPLLHLWSLGIEEQYYIVWPLVLALTFKYRRDPFLALMLLLMSSLVLNIAKAPKNPVTTFFLPQTRVWELLIGSLLAYLTLYRSKVHEYLAALSIGAYRFPSFPITTRLLNIFSFSGVALLSISFWYLDKSKVFPGWWALLPTFGALLLIAAGPHAWINDRLLSHPLAVFVGKISFPLYLWHWPVLFAVRLLTPTGHDPLRDISVVLLSVFLSWITYRVIEGRLRFSKVKMVPIVLSAVMLVIGAAGFAMFKGFVEPRNNSPAINKIFQAIGEWDYPGVSNPGDVLLVGGSPRKVLFLGDSNIEQYWPRIEALVRENASSKSAIFLTSGGCPPIPGVREVNHPNCDGLFESLQEYAEDPSIDAVAISASWSGYFSEKSTYFISGVGVLREGSAGAEEAFKRLSSLLAMFRSNHKKIYLVLQIPMARGLDPQYLFSRRLFQEMKINADGVDKSQILKKMSSVMARLREIGTRNGAEIIDPVDFLCNEERCPALFSDGEPIYKDGSHLRPSFVRRHAQFLDKVMM